MEYEGFASLDWKDCLQSDKTRAETEHDLSFSEQHVGGQTHR